MSKSLTMTYICRDCKKPCKLIYDPDEEDHFSDCCEAYYDWEDEKA
jgi:hypothetical protein